MVKYKRFDIEVAGKKIIVDVELVERFKREKVTICSTSDVLSELKLKKIDVGKCLQSPDIVSNRKRNRITGRWVFSLPIEQKRVITQKTSRKTSKK
tara:strand:+ start:481 stop:768 length:288 start_codon:yes stop_codon:yes gene_type:complete